MKIQETIENLKYIISDDCTDNQTDFIEEVSISGNLYTTPYELK